MVERLTADASPEKRLFISLLTRDIPLVAAFLDLVDNSVNSAVEPFAGRLRTAQDYVTVYADESISPQTSIDINVSRSKIEIADNASGISAKTAADHVFKFGRDDEEEHATDRLSVYGIGLKRAMFKIGNRIKIRSDHVDGGFDLDLNVKAWAKDKTLPWTFTITERAPVKPDATGTKITITELYDDVERRVSDGVFEGELKEAIARTYSYYLAKFVRINVGSTAIVGDSLDIGTNHTSDEFSSDGVSCAITAGIAQPVGGVFRARSSGWFVFCNGRGVIAADKGPLTGWGGVGLPQFQPKHRPFLGTVFFVSERADKLPWTTTKSGINEDSAIWQEAKRHMATVGRLVITFLDSRYSDEGTEVASKDVQEAAGPRQNVITASTVEKRSFEPPKRPPPVNVRVQYDAKIADVKRIEQYLRRPGMGAAEVGRHTFHYFLRNEVGES